jgi:Fe-coproporphyrin III synthase
MLHLTGRCNLECQHCYMNGSPRRKEELPFDWIVQSLNDAPSLGITSLFLTGGEPLLYPRFMDIAKVASDVGGLSTTVCTNATLLRDRDAHILAELGLDVHVSIDGDSTYHDRFRNAENAFVQAERGIQHLVKAKIPVTVVTTISKGNFDQFPAIASRAIGLGAERLLVQPLLDLGRGSSIQDQCLTSEQLNILILQISDVANSVNGRIKASIIGGSRRFLIEHPCAAYVCNGGGCHRGVSAEIKKIIVREDGTILPEATNLHHNYAIGKVADGSLGQLVERYFAKDYDAFHRLCRFTYEECVPNWPDPIVPWDQLLAIRSHTQLPIDSREVVIQHGCSRTPHQDSGVAVTV